MQTKTQRQNLSHSVIVTFKSSGTIQKIENQKSTTSDPTTTISHTLPTTVCIR